MNRLPLRPSRDPFETLFSLFAAGLSAPPATEPPRCDAPAVSGKPPVRGGSLLDRLDRWLWKARQRDLERALTFATDVVDVERRLRERERSMLQRYY
jgi:hypothetical protein